MKASNRARGAHEGQGCHGVVQRRGQPGRHSVKPAALHLRLNAYVPEGPQIRRSDGPGPARFRRRRGVARPLLQKNPVFLRGGHRGVGPGSSLRYLESYEDANDEQQVCK